MDEAQIAPILNTVVKLVAYIAPFFLIPATFKFGLGVFGNLAGMVNDKSRGVFDKQRKFRSGTRQREFAKAKAGERFNNRGLNAFTSQVTTGGITPGRRRANYQQKINNASAAFGKSEQAQAVQHNDGALQALTYGSAVEARAGLARGDFGTKSQDEINDAINAARASGGFGRDRQVYAASQLSKTGTGYDNIEQVAKTVARVSHGNSGQAAALAGDINSSTKGAGRNDLAPGFSALNSLAQAEMAGGGSAPNPAQYHEATVKAARGVDPVTLLRNKPAAVKQLTQSLADHADAQRRVMNSVDPTVTQAQRDKAKDEFIQTMGQMDQLNQNKSYASAEVQEHVNTMSNDVAGNGSSTTLNGLLADVTVPGGGAGPLTAAQATQQAQQEANQKRWAEVRAPRINANDPNAGNP